MSSHNHYSPILAKVYDPVIYFGVRKIRKAISQEIFKANANSIIDMCCGTGNQLKYLQSAGIENLKGIDISENMLAQSYRNGLSGICEKMDASNTNFQSNNFDVAIISFALHEMHHTVAVKVMTEARRIVKPGGKIIITDYLLDVKTTTLGRIGATGVEWFVGGEHYQNFKYFIANQLLEKLTQMLALLRIQRFAMGAVGVWVFENKKGIEI